MQEMRLKLERYINNYLELWDFSGVIQVRKKEEILFEKAYGYSCIEFGLKNTMHSRFSIASLSKQFTAFAIMHLYDKKLLDIDKPANLYLPDDMKIHASITIHHLLSHTSGLYNFYNFENDFFSGYNRMDYSKKDFFHRYINKHPAKRPGKEFDYNNSNYNLLAWVIENVSGDDYENYLRSNLFQPLEMKSSDVDDGSRIIRKRAYNYVKDFANTVKSPYHNEKFSIGAGAIVTNCEDLSKWYSCLRDRKILSQKSYTRFFHENKNNYCYGLEHHHMYGTDRYSHGGDHLGICTYMQSYYEEDICIIILSNNEAIDQYKLGNAISDILHYKDVEMPKKHQEFPLSERELQTFCGTYLENKIQVKWMKGKLYFTRFSGNLHIEIYPIDKGKFVRRHSDQVNPYHISENEDGKKTFFGYVKK
ncbi:beta-lactamase family protein [Gracilibacillus oryzae]|uniref:Beta-lactamase family protein n=1 Tax=Gracilibacillus oryzae TaxID=1672701 RepID=A0A7C8GSZ0_9BACI|nr:serine hydrolase domain-containing protein [Gracilibacillus oryzae]KAB8135740.1 beta-lactamase family protein [Gracilibacillus oryzae]